MIASLRGRILEKDAGRVVIEAGGVGYELAVNPATAARLPESGEALLHVSESVAMYGGGTTLYGFASREEKELFLCLKDNVPSTGAKKALEYLEKASRSLPDFRRAVHEGDARALSGVFGFTRKTAERLLAGLKDKLGPRLAGGSGRVRGETAASGNLARALDALEALGYKPSECRPVLDELSRELPQDAPVEEMLRVALRRL